MSAKKPVVVEFYDEIVFPDPSEAFLSRLQSHPAVNLPRLPPGLTLPPPGMLCSNYSLLSIAFHFPCLS